MFSRERTLKQDSGVPPGRNVSGRLGVVGRRFHVLALSILLAVVAAWVLLMAIAARDADLAAESSGIVTAVFPLDTTLRDVFLATEKAGGSIVSDTWLPNVWVLHSDTGGYAGRLRDSGAVLVLDVALFESITIPTCGGV